MGSNIDLRGYQDPEELSEAFGKLLSGKSGYKPIIERRQDPVKCIKCSLMVPGGKKFCPQCGEKVEQKPTSAKCKGCGTLFNDEDSFCGECGAKRE